MTSEKYLNYTMEQKESSLKPYGRTFEDLKKDVEAIKLWLLKQPHIPQNINIDDTSIEHSLVANKFIFKNAKRSIDWFFCIKNIYPEYFKEPYDESIVIALNHFYILPLPKMTPNNIRVIISKLRTKTLDPKLTAESIVTLGINLSDLIIKHDCPSSKIIVFDCENYTIEFCTKFSPVTLRIIQIIFEKAYHNGVRELHGINVNPFLETFLNVAKAFMNPKIARRITVHKSLSSLQEFLSKEILPKDYGGDEVSMDELHEMWKEELMRNRPFFEERKLMVTDESLRIGDLPDCDFLGVEGNFRKLAVD